LQIAALDPTVRQPLHQLYYPLAAIGMEVWPNAAAASHGEQKDFAVAGLFPTELQHFPQVGASQPFLFCHASLLPQHQIHRAHSWLPTI
jgi:hypothetical protein